MNPAPVSIVRDPPVQGMQCGVRLRQGGFSFIELVLVIILIGVVTVVAAPRLTGALISGTDILASETRLMGDLRQARHMAMICAEGSVTVRSTNDRQYQIIPQNCAGVAARTLTLERNTRFVGNFSAVFLYPRGNLQVTNAVGITLDDRGNQRSLCIRPHSGRVSRGAC